MAKRFIQYFEDSFKENWDLPAMTNYVTKQTYAYKDVAREIAKLHILFRKLNIQQDDKIALVGNNTPEWAITFLATITYGAVIVPILQDFHPDDIAHIIEHSESKLLFIGDSYWDRLEEKDTSTLRAVFSLSDFRCMRQAQGETLHLIMRQLPTLLKELYPQGVQRKDVRYAEKDDDQLFVINYTSGTSEYSKGVMLSGDNFCCVLAFAIKQELGFKGCDILSYLPLAHAYGCTFDFICQMITGGHVTMLPKIPSAADLLKAMSDVRPDWIAVVPMILEAIYRKQIQPVLSKPSMKILTNIPLVSNIVYGKMRDRLVNVFGGKFRKLFVGGAPFDSEVEDFYAKINFPFAVAYGMTECAPLISVDFQSYTPHSVGKAIDGVSIAINSENPLKMPGEILVKGRNVMKGYFKNCEATLAAFDSDGWLKTGDMGILDKHGNLFVKGRTKAMILTSSGQNVYPEEIESKLNNSPYIAESLVVQRGAKIVALVVPNKELVGEGSNLQSIMMEQIKAVNKQLPAYAYIHSFEIQTTVFERTPKKSVKRYLYQ